MSSASAAIIKGSHGNTMELDSDVKTLDKVHVSDDDQSNGNVKDELPTKTGIFPAEEWNNLGLASRIKEELRIKVKERLLQKLEAPHLAFLLIGNDPASEIYVANKIKDCKEVNFRASLIKEKANITEEEVLRIIHNANKDPDVHGFMIQLPLPKHLSKERILNALEPIKDVDGLHHLNFGRIGTQLRTHMPATAYGIAEMLRRRNTQTKGKHVVVVGRSYLVGLPTAILLARGQNPGDATVTITHRHTKNLAQYTKQADILITAVGKPNLITADMVKKGVIAIDVGITRIKQQGKYKLVGDLDFQGIKPIAKAITPVPNGIGPMTRAALLMNTLNAAKAQDNT